MSTRANIAIVKKDGTVDTVYNHSDGYPSYLGDLLLESYTDKTDNDKTRQIIDDNNIEFETAWNMPYGVLKAISELWGTKVECDYADEDIGSNCGTVVFDKGEVIKDIEQDRKFALDLWGYDDEDYN